jgi:hypothetical protein
MPGTPYPTSAENYGYAQNRLDTQGLAAIYAEDLERGQLFEGLLRRDCYATTFWRPVIELDVSGIPMGKAGQADAAIRTQREITATVVTAHRGRYHLFRNNQEIASGVVMAPTTRIRITDDMPLEDVCIKGAPKHPGPYAVYDLKIESQKSQFAWSSPVWVDL